MPPAMLATCAKPAWCQEMRHLHAAPAVVAQAGDRASRVQFGQAGGNRAMGIASSSKPSAVTLAVCSSQGSRTSSTTAVGRAALARQAGQVCGADLFDHHGAQN
jgi:hypothetical protein